MKKELQNAREEYSQNALDLEQAADDPIEQFKSWFNDYRDSGAKDFNAMTLSTASKEGQPSSRVVLLKGIEDDAFEFYSNYNSDKGTQMARNPAVALNFFWAEPERQVRVEGIVRKMPQEESEEYFQSRPRGSQIGAYVSPQSEVIKDRDYLEQRQHDFEAKFEGENIPKPEHWGGYRVYPHRIEFWQGRSNRLHDRLNYNYENGRWKKERLAP